MREAERKSLRRAKQLRNHMPDAEVILWSRLRRQAVSGRSFRRQHPIGPYIADFACLSLRLVIEVDGESHCSAQELAYDARRTAYMKSRRWEVLRSQTRTSIGV
jgi:very-short-patch-repair endonuclease